LIRVFTACPDRVQSSLCRLKNENAPFFGADTIQDHDRVMGDKPLWLEGSPTEDFFLCTNQAPVPSLNYYAALKVAHRNSRALVETKFNIRPT